MDVSNAVIVLVGSGSDLVTADEDVLELPLVGFFFDSSDDIVGIFISLKVDASVPLAIFVFVANVAAHGKLHNEHPYFPSLIFLFIVSYSSLLLFLLFYSYSSIFILIYASSPSIGSSALHVTPWQGPCSRPVTS